MTTLNSGAQTVAPNFQAEDDKITYIAQRYRNRLLDDAPRVWLPGRGSTQAAPAFLCQDYGLVGFADHRNLRQAILDVDADNRATILMARDIIAGSRIELEAAPAWILA